MKTTNIIVAAGLVVVLLISGNCSPESTMDPESIMIPTRDGTLLATDLYFPENSETSHPVVLMRTPYNRSLLAEYGEFYSRHGYVVAIQDVRGKYESEGEWIPYRYEGKDGYDAVEWLAAQKWANGKVGMVGGSYLGSVQLAAAIEKPPSLITIIPNITPATPLYNTPYENGVFALGWAIRWSDLVHDDISAEQMNQKFQEVFSRIWYDELNSLPVIDLDKKIIGKEIEFWREWAETEAGTNNGLAPQNYLQSLGKIDIPVFLQSGWFDVANRGTKMIHETLSQSGNPNVKLIIGPWVHSDRSSKQLGPLFLGEEAGIDLFEIYKDWFDYWLKGIDNGIIDEPPVQLFNIGPNNWVFAKNYPTVQSVETKLFLGAIKSQTQSPNRGILKFTNDTSDIDSSNYRYNPSNPTPSFFAFLKKNRVPEYKDILEKRSDVLIFETEALHDSLTIAGPVSAVLFASSSAVDTDFSLTLTGVDRNENIFPLGQTFGIIRAKYRNSDTQPELLKKNRIYKYEIDLSHTYYTLAPGQKIRLEIASASFPEYSRNLNTGFNSQTTEDWVVAEQEVYYGNKYPSSINFYTIKSPTTD